MSHSRKTEWDVDTTLRFIEDYKSRTMLWYNKDEHYKNNALKKAMLQRLGQKFGMSSQSARKKIKSLRTIFHREHKRILTNKELQDPGKQWFAYRAMRFIMFSPETVKAELSDEVINVMEGEETAMNEEDEDVEIPGPSQPPCMSHTYCALHAPRTSHAPCALHAPSTSHAPSISHAPSTSHAPSISHAPSTSRAPYNSNGTSMEMPSIKREELDYVVLPEERADACSERDDSTVFGEYVGNEIRKLPAIPKVITKHLINNVLYSAAIGKYNNPNARHKIISQPSFVYIIPSCDDESSTSCC